MLTSLPGQAACGDFCSLPAGSSQWLTLFLLFLGAPPSSYLSLQGPLSLPLWWRMSLQWQRWQELYCWEWASSSDRQACESLFHGMGHVTNSRQATLQLAKPKSWQFLTPRPCFYPGVNDQMGITRNETAVRTCALQLWCLLLVFPEAPHLLLISLSSNILLC